MCVLFSMAGLSGASGIQEGHHKHDLDGNRHQNAQSGMAVNELQGTKNCEQQASDDSPAE